METIKGKTEKSNDNGNENEEAENSFSSYFSNKVILHRK